MLGLSLIKIAQNHFSTSECQHAARHSRTDSWQSECHKGNVTTCAFLPPQVPSLKVLPHFLLSALLQTLALANRFLDGEDAGSVDKLSGLECLADQTTRKFEAFAFLTGPRTRG